MSEVRSPEEVVTSERLLPTNNHDDVQSDASLAAGENGIRSPSHTVPDDTVSVAESVAEVDNPILARGLSDESIRLDTSNINIKALLVSSDYFVDEPTGNIRSGIRGADIRSSKNVNHHETPHMIDSSDTLLLHSVDIDGYPYKVTDEISYIAPMISEFEKRALLSENPEVTEQFKRVRNQELEYHIRKHRNAMNGVNWFNFMLGCSDPRASSLCESEWDIRKAMESRRYLSSSDRASRSSGYQVPEADEVPPAQVEYRREVFSIVAGSDQKTITPDQALNLAYIWGYIPSSKDVATLNGMSKVSYSDLVGWMSSIAHPEDKIVSNLEAPLKVTSFTDKEVLSEFALRHILMNYGECLSPEEADYAIKVACVNAKGNLEYSSFVGDLLESNRQPHNVLEYRKFGLRAKDLPEGAAISISLF